jgi:spore maturation protein A
MINYIWAGMIIAGIAVAALTGRMQAVTLAAVGSAKEAVEVCLTTLGVVAMWTGLMKIAEEGGIIKTLSRALAKPLSFLFPRLNESSAAREYIAANFIANILGLGWAATPAGLKAMAELQKLNPNGDKTVASNEMCVFLIVNMSSLQLITVSIVAYRMQYGSKNPSEIIGPGILATIISSAAGIIFAKAMDMTSGEGAGRCA